MDPEILSRLEAKGVWASLMEALLAMPWDWRGHFRQGQDWESDIWSSSLEDRREQIVGTLCGWPGALSSPLTKKDVQAILEAYRSGNPLDRFIPVLDKTPLGCLYCAHSGILNGPRFETNGVLLRTMDECPFPDGLDTHWYQDFPSGKMLVGNDFRWLTRLPDMKDLNSLRGIHEEILEYAKVGLALGFGIGNTNPHVYRMPDGSLEIGSKRKSVWFVDEGYPGAIYLPETEKWGDGWYVETPPADAGPYGKESVEDLPEGCVDEGVIYTGLWAYSVIDLEDARKRALYHDPDVDWDAFLRSDDVFVLDVAPGKYRFDHNQVVQDRHALKVTFARIERVGEADPCFDWCGFHRNFQVHLSQAVQLSRFPTLDESGYWRYMANQVMRGCIPSRDWHANGFPHHFYMSSIQDVPIVEEIPRFTRSHFTYYEVACGSLLLLCTGEEHDAYGGAMPLNGSFALGVGRVLESVIKFGIISDRWGSEIQCKKVMRQAMGWWDALVARHPHVADDMSDFAEWMSDRKAVKAHIRALKLPTER